MPAVKDVLRHVTTQVAGRQRKCYRQPRKHLIAKGELCLVVRDAPQRQSTYCMTCAREILDLAETRLEGLLRSVSSSSAGVTTES